jgi:hypothetical protein
LIKKVYEVDPLLCPKCGGQMKIIAFLERRDQAAVINRILKHRGLCDDPPARVSPGPAPPERTILELEYIDTDEFLAAL